jgi:ABC-type phosphate/phosphonate transport system substrate-binding protein
MRNVASVLDSKASKRLIEITKSLMQKGLQYKQDLKPEQREEVTNALKTLIKELKECTEL